MKRILLGMLFFAASLCANSQTFQVQNLNVLGTTNLQGATQSPSFTQFGVLVGGGGASPVVAIAPGSVGQVLTSNGPTSNPSFQTTSTSGFIQVQATGNLTAQTASIGSTVLFTTVNAGLYVLYVDVICTTAGTAGTVAPSVFWGNGSSSQSATGSALFLSTLGNESSTSFPMYVPAGQNISYSTVVTGAAGSPQYSLRLRLVYLG